VRFSSKNHGRVKKIKEEGGLWYRQTRNAKGRGLSGVARQGGPKRGNFSCPLLRHKQMKVPLGGGDA